MDPQTSKNRRQLLELFKDEESKKLITDQWEMLIGFIHKEANIFPVLDNVIGFF